MLFSGLRIRYNDTATYIDSYNNMPEDISWVIGDNPAFQVVNKILKTLGISANGFIMFYSLITVSIYVWFIRKYSSDFSLSLYILLTGGAYVFSLAAIKQCMAIAIGLLAIDAAIQKRMEKIYNMHIYRNAFSYVCTNVYNNTTSIFEPWTKKVIF